MSSTTAGGKVELHMDTQSFRLLFREAGQFDQMLARNLRRSIRDAGKKVMTKTADAIANGGGPYKSDVGLRAGIAKGLRVQISTTTRQPGVRIVATGAGLPPNKQRMPNVWENDTFRHHVFGDASVWVEQSGHRAFFKTIYEDRAVVTTAVESAMKEAAAALGREIH